MTQPKRILHFQGRMGRGGAESFMMNAFRKIDRSKYVFDFVIYEDYKDVTPYHKEIHELGGSIFVVPNPNRHIIGYMKAVKKLLKDHKFDIVHNEIFFGGGINLRLAKKAGISQRIAHSHATTDGKGNKFPYGVARPFFNALLMKNATNYLACSHEAGLGLFGEKQPFLVIPNGIDIQAYASIEESKDSIRESLGLPTDAVVVGHIGRFEEQKNHRYLLDIFQEVTQQEENAYLLSVGKGSLEEEMFEKAEKFGIKERVLFLGERDDIPRILKAMDVFVMPSLYEGLPMVAVEAQAANLKLVLSTEISPDTVLSENVHFVSLKDSVEKWAETILKQPFGNTPLLRLSEFDNHYTASMLEKVYSSNT